MRHLIGGTATLFLLVAGCHPDIYLGDDEGGTAGIDSGDRLSQPYAAGTKVELSAYNLSGTGWSFVSDDSAMLAITEQKLDNNQLTATVHAASPGTARLRLVDGSGKDVRDASLQIVAPDHIKTFAHSALRLLGQSTDSPDPAETPDAQVVVGGTAVFAIGYFHGEQRLYGRGIVAVDPMPGVDVEPKTSSGRPVNEWIFVTPSAVGSTAIALHVGGQVLGILDIAAVPDTVIASLALGTEDSRPGDGDKVWVAARTQDGAGKDVFGAYSSWTLDGVTQTGEDDEATMTTGDLYRFRFAEGGPQRSLVASLGALTATTQIPAKDGVVKNTTYLGCSAAPGTSAGSSLVFGVGLLAGALWLRRRARPA